MLTDPTPDGVRDLAAALEMELDGDEVRAYCECMRELVAPLKTLERLQLSVGRTQRDRASAKPTPAENPYHAWVVKTAIREAPGGVLDGKRIAIKDNIAVAGVPMGNGTHVLGAYVPDQDATVVARILDAGGKITGKAACEYWCVASNSGTSAGGSVENPAAPGRTTGGSSSGSAALLRAGKVDLSVGSDQAGSIRMPASFCGIVGLKPTYGLVPFTGAVSLDYSIDHLGPMARTVEDCALLLGVIAGADGLDGRQGAAHLDSYTSAVGAGVKGLRIGVVDEGFGRPESENGVDAVVSRALENLVRRGAEVGHVHIPWHATAPMVWLAVTFGGIYQTLVKGHSIGFGTNKRYDIALIEALEPWDAFARDMAPTLKCMLLVGEMLERTSPHLYAQARNLVPQLRAAYDEVLATFDVLVMPTTPMTAPPLLGHGSPVSEVLSASWGALANNTCPFNLTGHPAISVCGGDVQGRPVGVMIIGRHFSERTVLRVASEVHRPAAG